MTQRTAMAVTGGVLASVLLSCGTAAALFATPDPRPSLRPGSQQPPISAAARPTGAAVVVPQAAPIPASPEPSAVPDLSTRARGKSPTRSRPPGRSAQPSRSTARPSASTVYYANCAAARAAGAAPLHRGQPGYRTALDPDNDGVACE